MRPKHSYTAFCLLSIFFFIFLLLIASPSSTRAIVEASSLTALQGGGRPTPQPKPRSTPRPVPRATPRRATRTPSQPTSRETTVPQIELVLIPAGTFMMGSPASEDYRFYDEGPQHQVTVQSFYMGKYEVTQEQYQAVMGKNPSTFKGANLPVDTISWNDAVKFCRKLSRNGQQYRLPTEAEWEYACRAGTTTPFAFGSSLSSAQANFNGDYPYGEASKGIYLGQTTPVGSFSPNKFGLYDMHGNVSEWCLDVWHRNYNGAPTNGSAWLTGGADTSTRMIRGGWWNGSSRSCRSAVRLIAEDDTRSSAYGFRVVANARS